MTKQNAVICMLGKNLTRPSLIKVCAIPGRPQLREKEVPVNAFMQGRPAAARNRSAVPNGMTRIKNADACPMLRRSQPKMEPRLAIAVVVPRVLGMHVDVFRPGSQANTILRGEIVARTHQVRADTADVLVISYKYRRTRDDSVAMVFMIKTSLNVAASLKAQE